jgi:hypothetical protein
MSGRNQAEMNMEPVRAVDVLEALSEEDMERLRIRRLRGTQAGGDVDGRLANNGLARPNDLGLGMVAKEVKDDVLPLKSGFYDWAMEYFREPQMKVSEPESVSNGRLEFRVVDLRAAQHSVKEGEEFGIWIHARDQPKEVPEMWDNESFKRGMLTRFPAGARRRRTRQHDVQPAGMATYAERASAIAKSGERGVCG